MSDRDGLVQLFAPASIAVYGASTEAGSMGHRAVANLRKGGYTGALLPINPRYAGQVIDGLTWRASASDHRLATGTSIDHAVLLVRAQASAALVDDCIAAGVRSISILSGGFGETGPDGAALQERIASRVRSAGIRLLGPNCLGFVNVAAGVYASPASVFEVVWPGGGPLAIISRSGAVAADFLARGAQQGVGTSFWVSTGNEADISAIDCIEYVCEVEQVKVIALYLESIADVAAFKAAATRAAMLGKTIIAVRPGRTPAGISAIQSHTAAMVTADVLYDALFRQLGIVRVDSQRELIDMVRVAAHFEHRPRGIALATSSGGNGAMAADAAFGSGVPLATISLAGRQRMRALVPACSPDNPVDITGAVNQSPQVLPDFFAAVLDEPGVDCMVMIHGSGMLWRDRAEKISATLMDMARRYPAKRIVFVGMLDADLTTALAAAGIETFDDAVALVRAIGLLPPAPADDAWQAVSSDAPEIAPPAALAHSASPGRLLDEDQALDLLEGSFKIPVVARQVIERHEDLSEALNSLGFPVVMKAILPNVAHKSEVGAVQIDIGDVEQARLAWASLAAVCGKAGVAPRMLIEKMIGDTVSEILLSALVDPLLGPFITVGAGGTLTETINDVTVAPAPVSHEQARAMLRRLRGWPRMLRHRDGTRGNEAELLAAIVALSQAITQGRVDVPGSSGAAKNALDIVEIEINPFLLRSAASCAVDAVVRVVGDAPGND